MGPIYAATSLGPFMVDLLILENRIRTAKRFVLKL
ncbi:hypothetical protein X566_24300 [Afipia sp. P52-10]|nr:hypothetical protein X566_24300 [Afipia sp. P52-10]